jgi:hypothetical protein
MVYNTQNYWIFELFPSSDILENRKHDVSETDTRNYMVSLALMNVAGNKSHSVFCAETFSRTEVWIPQNWKSTSRLSILKMHLRWGFFCANKAEFEKAGILPKLGFAISQKHFPGQENRINGRRDPLRWPRDTLYSQKLALTSPTRGGRSVGIVRLRTKAHGV